MIEVEVYAPRRCKGKYSFADFREFYQWMAVNFKRPISLNASALLGLAERGHFEPNMAGLSIICSYDKPVGYLAKELARETGLLKTRMGSDIGFDLKKSEDYLERLSQLSVPPT